MKIVITAFVALVLAIPGALGAEKVFWGASGAAWEVDGNWSDGMVPTAADDVRIPAGVIVKVVSTATAKSLTLESGAAVSVFGKTQDFIVKESASDLTSAGRYAADSTSTEAIGLYLAGNLTLKAPLSRFLRDNLSRIFTKPLKTLDEKYFRPVPNALRTFFWRRPNHPKTPFFTLFDRHRRSSATAPPRAPVRSRDRDVPVVRLRTRAGPSVCRRQSASSAVR